MSERTIKIVIDDRATAALERIADALEKNGLGNVGEQIKEALAAPSNIYGEGLVDGIQNAIERGQRGMSTYR